MVHRYRADDRFYKGSRFMDELELFGEKIACEVFGADWATLRPLSGHLADMIMVDPREARWLYSHRQSCGWRLSGPKRSSWISNIRECSESVFSIRFGTDEHRCGEGSRVDRG